jgi:1,4-dihydroxy-2-naphthoate octaprenyltransferase
MNLAQALILLRIPFSFFLSPVFFFAFSMCDSPDIVKMSALFVALHLFIYPASNAYNSYMDQDEGSIGGLKNPPKAGILVLWLSIFFNVIGFAIVYFMVGRLALILLAIYVLASTLYSWKGVRLKKYAVLSFLTVMFFQGAFIFSLVFLFGQLTSYDLALTQANYKIPAIISSILIAGVYPMTQIYQHKADAKSGVRTLSMFLGIRGTFAFCGIAFGIATALLGYHFIQLQQAHLFYIFLLFNFPLVAFFMWWALKVWGDPNQANFRYTMMLNKTSSIAMVLYFLIVYYIKHTHELPF